MCKIDFIIYIVHFKKGGDKVSKKSLRDNRIIQIKEMRSTQTKGTQFIVRFEDGSIEELHAVRSSAKHAHGQIYVSHFVQQK